MINFEPALFLEEYYCDASTPLRTLTRLEIILLDKVSKECALNPVEGYYDQRWVKTLLMIDGLYLEFKPDLVEDPRYKSSALWVARWLLELLQRRPQLSANNICASLSELVKERESLVESLESTISTSNISHDCNPEPTNLRPSNRPL